MPSKQIYPGRNLTNAERVARYKAARPGVAKRDRDAARARAKEFTNAIKVATPCMDCGGYFPAVAMDFDHVSGEKEAHVGTLVSKGVSVKRIAAEVAKCELVCACCHRVRTQQRFADQGVQIAEVF